MTTRRPRRRRRLGLLLIVLRVWCWPAAATARTRRRPASPPPPPAARRPPRPPPSRLRRPSPRRPARPTGSATAVGSPAGRPAGIATVGDLADRIAAAWTGVTTLPGQRDHLPDRQRHPAAAALRQPGRLARRRADQPVDLRDRRRGPAGPEAPAGHRGGGDRLRDRGHRRSGLRPRRRSSSSSSIRRWARRLGGPDAGGPGQRARRSAQVLQGFLTPIGAPLGALTPEQRDLPVTPAGQTTVEGKTCDQLPDRPDDPDRRAGRHRDRDRRQRPALPDPDQRRRPDDRRHLRRLQRAPDDRGADRGRPATGNAPAATPLRRRRHAGRLGAE